MNTLALVLSTSLALVTLWTTICVVNHMNRKTPFIRRLAFVLLGTGAAAMVIAPVYLNRSPTISEMLVLLALALLSFTERKRYRHSPPQRQPVTNP